VEIGRTKLEVVLVMKYLPRFYDNLEKYLKPNKVLVIYGPRQAGKTTLLKNFLSKTKLKYRFDSGEDIRIQEVLSSQDFSLIKEYASGYELIVIDEAQHIPKIGLDLKILVDKVPKIKVIVSGSSSFELVGQIGEPLVGRKKTLILFPLAQIELRKIFNLFELKEKLSEFLIFGTYPAVLTARSKKEKREILEEVAFSYLLKDVFQLERVKAPRFLFDLLKLLAFQVGSEVSFSELANSLKIDVKTVSRYLDILEKSFVIFSLRGFSRNLRKEITKKNKYYFYDNGIRNALIANFNDLKLRNDIGQLWENFLVIERIKSQRYLEIPVNNYFWRTWDQKEIDFLEERQGKLFAFEFKYRPKKIKVPEEFIKTYPNSHFELITKENYLKFLGVKKGF